METPPPPLQTPVTMETPPLPPQTSVTMETPPPPGSMGGSRERQEVVEEVEAEEEMEEEVEVRCRPAGGTLSAPPCVCVWRSTLWLLRPQTSACCTSSPLVTMTTCLGRRRCWSPSAPPASVHRRRTRSSRRTRNTRRTRSSRSSRRRRWCLTQSCMLRL